MKYSLALVPTSIKCGFIHHKFKISNHSTVLQRIKIFSAASNERVLFSLELLRVVLKKQPSDQFRIQEEMISEKRKKNGIIDTGIKVPV